MIRICLVPWRLGAQNGGGYLAELENTVKFDGPALAEAPYPAMLRRFLDPSEGLLLQEWSLFLKRAPAPFLALLASLLVGWLPGCQPAGPPPTSVQGKVLFHGSSLTAGIIVFSPDQARGCNGPVARGTVQTDGSYSLRTGEMAGAIPGWYRVTVVAVETDPATPGQRFAHHRSLLPAKYRDPELSGLTCEVRATRPNIINFDLE
jgi:hypothetical protein